MDVINDLSSQIATYYDDFIATLPRLLAAIVISTLVFFILRFLRKRLEQYLLKRSEDKLIASFANSILRIVSSIVILLLFLYVIGLAGVASSILGAAGISAFVIGFALKDIGENFLAGIIMAFDRPFRLGDTVKTGDVEGSITQMSLRDTHIKTFDGKDVYVPNGQIIKMPLYNYTIDGYLRQNFVIGVDYDTDIELVRSSIMEVISVISGILKDDKPPRTHVKNLNTSTVDIEVQFWIDTFDKNYSGLELKSRAQSQVVRKLLDMGIGMPADIIELKNYDDSLKTEGKMSQDTA